MCISSHHVDALRQIIQKNTLIVGVGNVLRGDDAAGPALIEELRGCTKAMCINAGSAPENYLGPIIKARPDTILIVDATHLGLETGQWKLLNNDDIANVRFSTHAFSAPCWLEYLQAKTTANLYLLAIQPGSIELGAPMSPEMKKTVSYLRGLLTA